MIARTMTEAARRLFAHADWANRRLLDFFTAHPDMPDAARRRLAHLLAAEALWLSRLEGESPAADVFPELDLDAMADLAERNRAGWAAYLAELDDHDMGRLCAYRTTGGTAHETAIGDVVQHVALHGSHHRGQICADARAAGQLPPVVDFIAYSRENGPSTR